MEKKKFTPLEIEILEISLSDILTMSTETDVGSDWDMYLDVFT